MKKVSLAELIKYVLSPLVALFMFFGILFFGGRAGVALAAPIQPVDINESSFPDANFRAVVSGSDIDLDGNGSLDENEIAGTINIYCQGMGITSLQGVEYFVNLQGLWCYDNSIESMNLSNNTDLRGLWCSGNPLTSLDLSPNPELTWVYCYDCNLTSLNVSGNPKMAYIECNTNPLTSLDVTHNPELEHLTCGSCELLNLDLTNNPKLSHLDAFRNHLTSLDISHNPKMKRLDIWDNPGLGSIDLSHNPGLQYYNCANNDAGSVDVSHNPELQKLICSYNHIKSLDLSNNPKIVYLDCAVNQIGSLDLSKNPDLYFLQAFTNGFSSLNIGNNPSLVKTYKEGKKKSEYDVCNGHSWTLDFGGDTSTGGDNIYFLCFDDGVNLITEAENKEQTKEKETDEDSGLDTENLITRETVAWTLYNFAGSPDVTGLKSRFTDVKEGAWYEDALLWGEKNSVCVGSPNVASDTFGVGEYITRQDMALMLMRYSEYKGYKRAIDFGRTDEYLDYYDIDFYAWEAITWAVTWNIMSGKGEPGSGKDQQKIDPHGKVTRAEFESTYKRMMEVNGLASPTSFPIPDIKAEDLAGSEDGKGGDGDLSGKTADSSDNQKSGDSGIDAGLNADSDTSDSNSDSGTSGLNSDINLADGTSLSEQSIAAGEGLILDDNDIIDIRKKRAKIIIVISIITGILAIAAIAAVIVRKRKK